MLVCPRLRGSQDVGLLGLTAGKSWENRDELFTLAGFSDFLPNNAIHQKRGVIISNVLTKGLGLLCDTLSLALGKGRHHGIRLCGEAHVSEQRSRCGLANGHSNDIGSGFSPPESSDGHNPRQHLICSLLRDSDQNYTAKPHPDSQAQKL